MLMDLGMKSTSNCDYMHYMIAVSLERSDEPFFVGHCANSTEGKPKESRRNPEALKRPPTFLLGGVLLVEKDLSVGLLLVYDAIDGAPVGQAGYATVVDEEVCLELAAEAAVGLALFGIVAVDGIELETALPTPLHRLVEELALAHCPEYELVTISDELTQSLGSKWQFGANLWVLVGDDGAVEINSNCHSLCGFACLWEQR